MAGVSAFRKWFREHRVNDGVDVIVQSPMRIHVVRNGDILWRLRRTSRWGYTVRDMDNVQRYAAFSLGDMKLLLFMGELCTW